MISTNGLQRCNPADNFESKVSFVNADVSFIVFRTQQSLHHCNNQTFAFLCSPDIKKCIVLNKILIPKMEMGNWSNLKEKIRQPLTPLHASGARDSLLPLLGTQPVLPAPVPVLLSQYYLASNSVPLASITNTIITQPILPVPVLLRTQPTLSV